MTEQRTAYVTTKQIPPVPTEPTGYKAIGRAVFAEYGDDVTVMVCECYASDWRGLTYKQACEEAVKIAAMMQQSIAY